MHKSIRSQEWFCTTVEPHLSMGSSPVRIIMWISGHNWEPLMHSMNLLGFGWSEWLDTAVLGNLAKPPKAQTVTEHVQLLILIIFRQLSMLSSERLTLYFCKIPQNCSKWGLDMRGSIVTCKQEGPFGDFHSLFESMAQLCKLLCCLVNMQICKDTCHFLLCNRERE